jgi:hypothetical protein
MIEFHREYLGMIFIQKKRRPRKDACGAEILAAQPETLKPETLKLETQNFL